MSREGPDGAEPTQQSDNQQNKNLISNAINHNHSATQPLDKEEKMPKFQLKDEAKSRLEQRKEKPRKESNKSEPDRKRYSKKTKGIDKTTVLQGAKIQGSSSILSSEVQGSKVEESGVRMSTWKQTAESAKVIDISPAGQGVEQIAPGSSGRKSVKAQGHEQRKERGRSKVTGKPPVSSRLADDGE